MSKKTESKGASFNTSSRIVFSALEEISRANRPLGVAELHRIIGEPTSSTHRALMTLEEAGFATRFGNQIKFGPGPMVHHLIRAMIARFRVREKGIPLLREVVQITEAPATLNARLGWFSIRVGWAEGRRELYDQRRIGQARLLHEQVAPVSMLSTFSDSKIEDYRHFVRRCHPERAAAASAPVVDREIETTRNNGYAVKPDINRPSGSWVSFPITGPTGLACCALTAAFNNEALPGGSGDPESFDKIRQLVAEFQIHLNENPQETSTPYDYMPLEDVDLTPGVEETASLPESV